jgi:Spy/CpxP family protein refolding chaperone
MKSAYELAMERLQKTAPSLSLTEEQKKQLAEIDSKYRAKIAEKELFLRDQIRKAQTEGKADDIDSLENQLASDVRLLQEECEAAKEKLRSSFAKL